MKTPGKGEDPREGPEPAGTTPPFGGTHHKVTHWFSFGTGVTFVAWSAGFTLKREKKQI